MRVALVHASFAVAGGAEGYVRDLAAGLTARGHQVRVYCRDGTGEPIRPRLGSRLARRLPGPARKALVHLADLFDPTGLRPRDLRSFEPDVVHLHNWQGLGVVPAGRIAHRYPTCHTVHDHAICDPNNTMANLGRWRALDALLAARTAWIVRRFRPMLLLFAAERTRDVVARRARPVPLPATRILPLAVPLDWHRLRWPPGRPDHFLFLGALSPHKGLDLLLDAWRRAPVPGTLLVAGDGPLRPEVERLAAESSSVHYLGYLDVEGKRAAFARAGWLVFPSRIAETYGLVCAESLMAGRPIIVSEPTRPPAAGPESALAFREPGQLRGTLEQAAAMPPERYARMAASAAADGRRLDWDAHLDALLGAYRVAAGRHR